MSIQLLETEKTRLKDLTVQEEKVSHKFLPEVEFSEDDWINITAWLEVSRQSGDWFNLIPYYGKVAYLDPGGKVEFGLSDRDFAQIKAGLSNVDLYKVDAGVLQTDIKDAADNLSFACLLFGKNKLLIKNNNALGLRNWVMGEVTGNKLNNATSLIFCFKVLYPNEEIGKEERIKEIIENGLAKYLQRTTMPSMLPFLAKLRIIYPDIYKLVKVDEPTWNQMKAYYEITKDSGALAGRKVDEFPKIAFDLMVLSAEEVKLEGGELKIIMDKPNLDQKNDPQQEEREF